MTERRKEIAVRSKAPEPIAHNRHEGDDDGLLDPHKFSIKQMDFIDHVVMIWMNRVRRGDRRIELPRSVLKAKAKEAAAIVKQRAGFCPNAWFLRFEVLMRREDDRGPKKFTTGYLSLSIPDIINTEWSLFFGDNANKPCQRKYGEIIKEDEVTIQTYDEALDCLDLVRQYAYDIQNDKAIEFVEQIDKLLKEDANT